MRRRGKRLLALALAGAIAVSTLTGYEKIEGTKAVSGNTTVAKIADKDKAGEQPGARETREEAARDKAGGNAAGENTVGGSTASAPREQWVIDARLYEDRSSDELYKKALDEEGGRIVIYSIFSCIAKVKANFEEDYPGITLEVYDTNTNGMSIELSTECNSGIRTADVVHPKEQAGDYMINFFDKGILHDYQPESIYRSVNQECLKDMTPLYFETNWWFYSTDIYTETPVSNWQDVIKPG